MTDAPAVHLLGVHGFPILDMDPGEQLVPIRNALPAAAALAVGYSEVRWSGAGPTTRAEFRSAREAAENGSLAERIATAIDRDLRALLSALPQNTSVVIAGYSSGGMGLYYWLQQRSPRPDDRPAAVAIDAPYQCLDGEVIIEGRTRGTPFQVPPMNCREIAAGVLPGRLLTLLAGSPTTIRQHDSHFPAEFAQLGLVVQRVVPGATHNSICASPHAHRYLLEFLRSRTLEAS